MLKPRALKSGDLIGVVAPAGPLPDSSVLSRGLDTLCEIGFRVALGRNVTKKYRYLAGSDEERLSDIMDMFANPEIKGIICLRGGYGSTRIIPNIDYRLVQDNPKVFIGYSDITALHIALNRYAGLITFLGPMVATDFGTSLSLFSRRSFLRAVTCREPLGRISCPRGALPPKVITPGRGTGKLVGGNLTLVTATLGTPYEIETRDSLLLLEDVGEDLYRIDRMLVQLRHSGKLKHLRGIIIGECVRCQSREDDATAGAPLSHSDVPLSHSDAPLSLLEVLDEHFGSLGIPCLYGLPLGHGIHKATIPLGVTATLDTSAGSLDAGALYFEEPALL